MQPVESDHDRVVDGELASVDRARFSGASPEMLEKKGESFRNEALLANGCCDGVLGVVAPAWRRGWKLRRAHVCPDGVGYSVGAYGEVFVVA